MTDPTSTILPVTRSGKEVYDSLMKDIEPDLLSDAIDTIDAKYVGETPGENKARMERYKQALVAYQKKYEQYRLKRRGDIRSFSNSTQQVVEQRSKASEQKTMTDLESAIFQA